MENETRCARCGTAFVCAMNTGLAECWCAGLPALKPVPGRACLCRDCLEAELKTANYFAGTASVRR